MAAIARLRELTTSPWLNRLRRGFIPLALLFIAYSAYRASDYLLPLLRTVSVPRLLLACMLWGLAQWIGWPRWQWRASSAFALATGSWH